MESKEILLSNIDKLHTTEMGIDRIKRNLKINTENLDLELGAGETIINKLNVTNDCKIESGAGKVSRQRKITGEVYA